MADDRRANLEPELDEKLDDDEPVRLQPDLAPEIASPLAPFAGAEPPSPQWFKDAIASAWWRNVGWSHSRPRRYSWNMKTC